MALIRHTERCRQACGFTLIELIVVLSLVLAILGLSIPKVVSTIGVMEFRRGVVLTQSFLRRSHLDSVAGGQTISLKLVKNELVRSDGKRFFAPKGLRFSLPPESKDPSLVVFHANGRNASQRLYINDSHNRGAVIGIDPLSGIPECRYY
ncbi:MAG: pilus assembly FimT family protein [Planctomycetota bacterium]|jgi:prepilin-type N-terminal cleavage/methylation domain-containing protein